MKNSILTAFLVLVCMMSAYTQSSWTGPVLTTENDLAVEKYRKMIDAFYSSGITGSFDGAEKVSIHYRYFPQMDSERGAIVISTGRTEAVVKYRELAFDLFRNGYSVYLFDHRGQGFSGRMAEDSEMGHVDNGQYYIDDMKNFYDLIVRKGKHEKIYLVAHSMGGLIGMRYLEEYPDDFNAAVFSSPMLGLSAYICPLAKALSGATPKYAPGQGPYSDDSTAFEGNSVTGSEIRYYHKLAIYTMFPDARVGGPSVQWLEESCKMMKEVFKDSEKIQTPFLLFSADNETVVNPAAAGKFIDRAKGQGKNCERIVIAEARHELLMEKDPQRNEIIGKSLEFFCNY